MSAESSADYLDLMKVAMRDKPMVE
jgi:hypothetical protein